eukprot:PhM_4_TR3381/c0_g1_i1/m.20302/K19191/mabO; 4-methylaminobutanoate oxidase (formaldehyde-forming)
MFKRSLVPKYPATGPAAKVAAVPPTANVVIIGGGIIGCSIAYHLSRSGVKDVLLLDRMKLSSGTTWHAAGLVGQLRATESETLLSCMGARVFPELAASTGQDMGFKQCGSLTMSRSKERTTLLKRRAAKAAAFGIEAHVISASEAKRLYPLFDETKFEAALWLPKDGSASASDACAAFARGARQHGATLLEGVGVERTLIDEVSLKTNPYFRTVRGVKLENGGEVRCNVVVNCGGMWARDLGRTDGVMIPLHPCEHFYAVTNPIPGVTSNLPVMRDPDRWAYYREWGGGLVVGAYETNAKPCFVKGVPKEFEYALLPDDIDHFAPIFEAACDTIPALRETQIRTIINGPEAFTIDNQYCLGEAPEVKNYFVAAGMNSSGIAGSSGVGWMLAHWILTRKPPVDLWSVDIRRFGRFMDNNRFIRDRSAEALGLHYEIPFPRFEMQTGRNLRRSPVHHLLERQGGRFGSKFGWEKANYFSADTPPTYSYFNPSWHHIVRAEQRHTRTEVSIFDVTSLAKYWITGPDVEEFCNFVFAKNVSVPVGTVVYTPMLNAEGGYESDVTVTRVAHDRYVMVSPTAQGTRDHHWLRRCLEERNALHISVTDVSSACGVFSIQGPKSPWVMAAATETSVDFWTDKKQFPPMTFKMVEIGSTSVRAVRISYIGEATGWELYVPSEGADTVYRYLMRVGDSSNNNINTSTSSSSLITKTESYNLRPAGYYCIEALRIASGRRAWGAELNPTVNPFQAGLSYACDFSKGKGVTPFNGMAALSRLRHKPRGELKRRLVSVLLDVPASAGKDTVFMWGGEPIYRDDIVVGYLRSAAFIDALDACGGLGYVSNKHDGVSEEWIDNAEWSVDVAAVRVPARISFRSLMDAFGPRQF